MKFGEVLKSLREEKDLSQEALAKALEVNQTTISMWELGKKYPDLHNFQKIIEFFDVTADFLLKNL